MGAIEDVYADLDADVSEDDFREAVEEKVEQMGGLADEETAAMLIAHELTENEAQTVADVQAGMEEVRFLAKVLSIGELRTFERDGDDEDGRVINVEAADETDSLRLTFWDGEAVAVDEGEVEVGDVLRVKGRPQEGYNGLEVSVDQAEQDLDATIDVEPGDGETIDALTMGQSNVTVEGVVLDTEPVRTFERDDGSEGRVANLSIGDETGRVRVTLWDDRADRVEEIDAGTTVEVVDGYVRERDGDLEVHVGEEGAIDELDDADVEYAPETTPIDDVELDETVDIGGVVRSTDPTRTFDRDDGSEGQVKNIRIQDDTDDIRVALWGEKADRDLAPGDEVVCADVEIQDGWQDDLEASAGWGSTVVVLEDGASMATTPDADDAGTAGENNVQDAGASTGLSAFADDGEGGETASDGTGGSTAGAEDGTADGEEVEFTGTVVQTGDPVIVDDGEQTVTVDTTESVRLGEEVTVRGRRRGDEIEAEELF
ncbi:nucleic acid binding OB-fold tRNA/helicase-type [Halorhabdus utahensis DSM 12940]|uniref:Nucleic acid binding OB-fold tRNA/helicase-type n=1 Tax=Halorhabdus utahensis (strain DSM 12940 / JCM 11049 / AX-2) TaxID=519442 RepID=C7NV02_HALUD|nr:single-stranded DNA binding protein [Halorhabdus utahensis]ACV12414.1 nucleic acid binding OB-fold tRNA/helicase-type [Halorhabdus utahensis DSM 12940]